MLALRSKTAIRQQLSDLLPRLQNSQMDELVTAIKDEVAASLWTDLTIARRALRVLDMLAELSGDELHQAVALRCRGHILLLGQGRNRAALRLYRRALKIHAAHGDRLGQALVYMTSIWATANLGNYSAAVKDGEWAGSVFAEAQEWRYLATVENNLAAIHNRSWEYETALERLEVAYRAYLKMGDAGEPFLANNYINRALALCYLARFTESLQASQTALEIATRHSQTLVIARARHNMGMTYFLMGEYNRALDLLLEARQTHAQAGQPNEAALCDLTITDCLLQLGRRRDALEKCRSLRLVFKEMGMRLEAAETARNQAVALAGLGQYADAIHALHEARELFETAVLPHMVARTDLELAALHLRNGEAGLSLEIALNSLAVLTGLSLPYEQTQAKVLVGRALCGLGRLNEARLHLEQGLETARREDWPYLLYETWYALARCARLSGDLPQAEHCSLQAASALERLRGHVMLEFRSDFVRDREGIYTDLVDLALARDDPEGALQNVERARAHAVTSLLAGRTELGLRPLRPVDAPLVEAIQKMAEERRQVAIHMDSLALDLTSHAIEELPGLQRRLQGLEKEITDYWHRLLIHNAGYAGQAALWEVQAGPVLPNLDPGTILLEYFTAGDAITAFVSPACGPGEARSLQVFRLEMTISEVDRLLHSLMLNLRAAARIDPGQQAGLLSNARGLLDRLYGGLVAPLVHVLEPGRSLLIVPHGRLHFLPFHALLDGQRYLLERHPIHYLPAAALLRYRHPVRTDGGGILALGYSYHNLLPHAVEEARMVAGVWGGSARVDADARLSTLHTAAGDCRLLHLACHGEFRQDNPLFSGLAFEDGWLTVLDIFNLRLQASLVTLSACQSGMSTLGGGDALSGLMRAFLTSGAASVLLTLWAVSDRAALVLMEHFYRQLASGAGKAEALRAAQLAMLEEPGGYRHPYYWAPFFLVGEPGAL